MFAYFGLDVSDYCSGVEDEILNWIIIINKNDNNWGQK